ncbi:MAG: helicase SNF2 [Clostridiales bacterium 43-6]|nr:MAG: helicase SNF2 [Clostridiales bacterium 43-6]
MGILHIDSNTADNRLIVTGDVGQILESRRAARFLKDNTDYILSDSVIYISITDSLNKSIDRVRTAAGYAKCDVEISGEANEGIQSYIEEESKFAEFSSKAMDIRNNHCNVSEFQAFQDALVANMPTRTLYNLQMLSAYHLAFSQNACNFSVPGAGKTSIVFGAYTYLKNLPDDHPRKVDRLLIIGPINAFGPWELEYEECFGVKPTSKRLTGKLQIDHKKQYFYENNPAELTLISYASVMSLTQELLFFLKKHKVMVVLDEAHKIKNTNGGIIAQSIMELAQDCKARVVLTGTPAPNGYEDLYNLFKFIWPTKEIVRFHIGQLKDMSRTPNDPRVDSLLNSISPFFIRIRKSDLGIPPAVNNPPMVVEMGETQRRIYDYIERKYIFDIANSRDQRFQNELVRARLIRLMQASTNPALLRQPLSEFADVEDVDFDTVQDDTKMLNEILRYAEAEVPAKYIAVKDILREIIGRGEKAIVWACYIKNIEMLRDYLASNDIDSRILYGATPVAGDGISEDDDEYSITREAIVKEFHKDDCPYKVIIANPFAVAESISLHKACHNAIYLERSFNAAHFLQSKDRIHRYGLSDDVVTNYYYLLSAESVDLTIHERLAEKERRLLEIIESMPIPLFDNNLDDGGDDDIKAVLRDYARRTKAD